MSRRERRPTEWLAALTVTAAFTTIYVPQPVLPLLAREFRVNEATASLAISAVVLGIALANLPFGALADRVPVRRLVRAGTIAIVLCAALEASTHSFAVLVAARFVQGLFVPTLTTCLAAFLSRSVPRERLNVAMGLYVAATVAGGLGGRLLGGFTAHVQWRWAFALAGGLVAVAGSAALLGLPAAADHPVASSGETGWGRLLRPFALLRLYVAGFSAFFVFSSVFNYLPFYLERPPFSAPTDVVTLLYLSYVVGIVISPLSGRVSNRLGNGVTMTGGALVLAGALALTYVPSLAVIVASLLFVCAGFFAVHASAAGALNRRVAEGRGRANSLYTLFYYLGGAAGISASGHAYRAFGWHGVIATCAAALAVPLVVGLIEIGAREPRTAAETAPTAAT